MMIRKSFQVVTILLMILGFSVSSFANETEIIKSDWKQERKQRHALHEKKLTANPDFKDMIIKKYNEDIQVINQKYKKQYTVAKNSYKVKKKAPVASKKSKKSKKLVKKKSKAKRSPKRSIASIGEPVVGADEMEWVDASKSGMYAEESRRKHYNKKGYRLPANVNVVVEEHDF